MSKTGNSISDARAWLDELYSQTGAMCAGVWQCAHGGREALWLCVSPQDAQLPLLNQFTDVPPSVAGHVQVRSFQKGPEQAGTAAHVWLDDHQLAVLIWNDVSASQVASYVSQIERSVLLWHMRQLQVQLSKEQASTLGYRAAKVCLQNVQGTRWKTTAMGLCNALAAELPAQRVSVLRFSAEKCTLEAMNHADKMDRRSDLVEALVMAAEECAQQKVPVLVPSSPQLPVISRQTKQYVREFGEGSLISMPLQAEQGYLNKREVVAVLVAEFNEALEGDVAVQRLYAMREVADVLAPVVAHQLAATRSWWARAKDFALNLLAYLWGPEHTGWKLAGVLLLLLTILGYVVPWEDSLKVNSQVVAVSRHQVCSPFEGTLEAVEVRRFERVQAGQLLARLAVDELQVERARLDAKVQTELLESRQMRSEGDAAKSQMAAARAAQAEAERDLIDWRLARAELRAPVDGVVLFDMLRERLGQRFNQGDMLLEVVPLEGLEIELQIPAHRAGELERLLAQNDAAIVAGEIACRSNPDLRWDLQVIRLSEVAMQDEADNTMLAIATFDGATPEWGRPGVEGVSRLPLGKKRVGWILIRDAVAWVRMKLWI